jgi:hypothetical protein
MAAAAYGVHEKIRQPFGVRMKGSEDLADSGGWLGCIYSHINRGGLFKMSATVNRY